MAMKTQERLDILFYNRKQLNQMVI